MFELYPLCYQGAGLIPIQAFILPVGKTAAWLDYALSNNNRVQGK